MFYRQFASHNTNLIVHITIHTVATSSVLNVLKKAPTAYSFEYSIKKKIRETKRETEIKKQKKKWIYSIFYRERLVCVFFFCVMLPSLMLLFADRGFSVLTVHCIIFNFISLNSCAFLVGTELTIFALAFFYVPVFFFCKKKNLHWNIGRWYYDFWIVSFVTLYVHRL